MKILLKIYSASCLLVLGFCTFFAIPWGLLPFSDAVDLTVVGGVLVASAVAYTIYHQRHEGLEMGWFLVMRGGFWVIVVGLRGIAATVCGIVLIAAPQYFEPAFEQGAFPFGAALVASFWFALIFMFAYLSCGMVATLAADIKKARFSKALGHLAIALVCLALAGVFFSLSLEVTNDLLVRITGEARLKAVWMFLGALAAGSAIYGFFAPDREEFE